MGVMHIGCEIENIADRQKSAMVGDVLVDTGSELTWIHGATLRGIGIAEEKRARRFQMANGGTLARNVGYALIRVGRRETVDEVVFAESGDLQLLGARTLEGLNVRVDAARKKLVAAGPILAA